MTDREILARIEEKMGVKAEVFEEGDISLFSPPPTVDGFPTSRALRISWEGSYFPNTAVHRLMIRKVRDLDTGCMWRGGARFEDRENGRPWSR